MKAPLARLALCAALTASLGCPGDKGGVAGVLVVSVVEVTPGITSVVVGRTVPLSAAPKTASGIAVPNRSVSWSSLNSGVASVSSNGVVTGVTVGGPVTIRATVDGVNGDALITVNAVPVNSVTVSPGNNPLVAGGQVQLTATARDANGVALTGRTFLWQSSDPNVAAVTTTGMVLAVAAGGPVTISATSEGKTGNATVTVSPRPADRLGFAQQPTASTAGAPFNPTIKVAVQDNILATVLSAANPVTIQLAANPGNATLAGTTTVNAVNGIATFGNISLNRVGTGYTFLVTSPTLTSATSVPFNITAGAAGRLTLTTGPPGTAQSGVALATQPVVQLVDVNGNNVSTPGVVVTASLASGAGTLGGTVTASTNAQGVAAFNSLSISGPVGSYTLGFNAPGVTGVNSGAIVLSAGPAAALAIVTQPSSTAQSATPLAQQPRVQLQDGAGNPVSQGGITVTAEIASGPAGSALNVTSAITNAGGLATFASLAITGSAGSYTLRFTAPGLTPAVSSTITLGAGVPTQIGVAVQPSPNATVNQTLAQQPAAQLRDAANNPVAFGGVTITVAPSLGATLLGTTTAVTNASGLATFTNLALSGSPGSYTLTFSAAGLTSGVSNAIALAAGGATQLGLSTQPPSGAQNGVVLAPGPVVQVRDVAGNPVAILGTSVSAVIASGPVGGVLSGTLSVLTNALGAATFSNLTITGPAGVYTLRFSASGLASVTSGNVTLGAGAATAIAANSVVTQSAVAGSAVTAPPSVKVTDASSNGVPGVSVTFAVTAGGGTVVPVAAVLTNASGIATATSWTLGTVAGAANTVTATAAVPSGSPVTFNATATVGPPSIITANSAISQSAQVNTAVGAPPSVKVTDVNLNPVTGAAVTFTLTGAGGSIVPASPAVVSTDALGIATLTTWTLGAAAGTNNYTVTATAAVPTGSPVTFTASGTAAAPGSMVANSTQTPTATVNTSVSAPPSVKVTDGPGGTGNPVPNVSVTFTTGASSGTTAPASPAVVMTNGSGVATLTSWTLGTLAGSQVVTATSPGLGSVVFTAAATADVANQVTFNSVTSQSAQVGTPVGAPPSVIVKDQFGNPVGGFPVSFAVTLGGGTVVPAAPTTVSTNASGIATTTSWTLGPGVGANTVRATAGTLAGSPIDFTATGTAGSATSIAAISATSQSAVAGTAVSAPPSVIVRDGSLNPVAGVVVTFAVASGGGSISGPAGVATDPAGIATVGGWTLGPTIGNNTLTATSGTLTGSPVIFSATGTIGPANKLAITQQPVGAASGAPLATQPIVAIQDVNGNTRTSDNATQVTVAIFSGAGGTLGGTQTVTAVNGIATFTNVTLAGTVGVNYVLQFTSSPALTVANSNNVTVTAGAATQLAINTQPVGGASGAALATQPVISIRDAQGNTVTADNATQVTAAIFSGVGGTLGGTVTRTAVNGVVAFTNLTLAGTVGNNYVLQFTSVPALTSVNSNNVTVTAGAATQLVLTQQPVGASSGTALSTQPVVAIRDGLGNTVTTDNSTQVTVAIFSGTGGTLGGTQTVTAVGGIATFTNVTLAGTVGVNYVLQFTSTPALTAATSNNVTVTVGAASLLGITTQPVGAASGAALATQPVVAVRDAQNNTVTTDNTTQVTVAIFSGAGGTLGGTQTVTAVNGLATFPNVTLAGTVGVNYVLRFTSSPALSPVNSNNVTITAGTASQLAITTQPVGGSSGAALATQPVVAIHDAQGNTVSTDNATQITVAILSGAGGTLGGTQTVTAASGVAAFTNLTLTGTIGVNYVLQFTSSPALTAANSNNVTVTAGAATQLALTQQPVGASSGTALATQPVVAIHDGLGNTVTTDNTTQVTVAIFSGTGGTLGGTQTVTAVSGIATFTNVTLAGTVGVNYVLRFTSAPALTAVNSNNVTVTVGAASQLVLTTQPVGAASGATLATQPVVAIRDAQGNTVTTDNATQVTAAILSGAGGTLGGTQTVTASNGIATFTNITLAGTVGVNYVLQFTSSPVLSAASSNNVTVTPGAATQLALTAQPVGGASGAALGTQPVVVIRDAQGNTVTTDNATQVTVAILSGAGGTLGGTQTVTALNGVATFTNLTLAGTVGVNYVLQFTSSPALTAASSNNVNVTAGTPTQMIITTQPPATGTSGAALTPATVITITDAQGNVVVGANVTVSIATGPGTLSGTLLVTTDVNGQAAFSNIILTGAGAYTLQFSATGPAPQTSITITIS